jgi:hypothetical protein
MEWKHLDDRTSQENRVKVHMQLGEVRRDSKPVGPVDRSHLTYIARRANTAIVYAKKNVITSTIH